MRQDGEDKESRQEIGVDFDTGMTSFAGPVFPPLTHTYNTAAPNTVPGLSQLGGLTGPDPCCGAVPAFSIQGRSSLFLPGEHQFLERAGRTRGDIWWATPTHGLLTVTGVSEDLPSHDVCLCMCVSAY